MRVRRERKKLQPHEYTPVKVLEEAAFKCVEYVLKTGCYVNYVTSLSLGTAIVFFCCCCSFYCFGLGFWIRI